MTEREHSTWRRLTQPGFQVELSYPAVTPEGHAVERMEERVEDHPLAGDFERVHLTAGDSTELYVELARFPDRTPRDEYEQHAPSLEQRFGEGAVNALSETTFQGRPAFAYAFRWDDGKRAVLVFQVASDTYRVIHDPRSPLNAEILATLTIAG